MNGMGGMGGGSGGGMGGGMGGGKKGGGKSPIANVRKRFMKTDIAKDEDGPFYDVQVQGDGAPSQPQPPPPMQGGMQDMSGMSGAAMSDAEMMAMGDGGMPPGAMDEMGGFGGDPNEEVYGEHEPSFDAFSEAAKRVYQKYVGINDLPSQDELREAGIEDGEADDLIELLVGPDEGPGDEMTMAGMGGGRR
jgi:hypothetical protein